MTDQVPLLMDKETAQVSIPESNELVQIVLEQGIPSPLTGRVVWFHPTSFMKKPWPQRIVGITKKYIICGTHTRRPEEMHDYQLWFWCRCTGNCINQSTRLKYPQDELNLINSLIGPPDLSALSIEPKNL